MDLWKQQIENIHLISSSKHDLPGSFGDLSRPVSLSLSKHARKFKKRKKRKKNEEKKRALIKTRIYNYCISYALPDYRDSGRSRPMENKRTGGGECRAGTGSPRKTFALARWMQHEIIPYQRQISADGSKPRAEARAWASFLVKLIVSLAQNPCLSNESAQKSNG